MSVAFEYRRDREALLVRRNVDEPNDSAVGLSADNREFAKVLVECCDDLPVIRGSRENGGVPRVLGPIGDVFDLMPALAKDVTRRSGDARIQQDLHEASDKTGASTRSWPTRRRA